MNKSDLPEGILRRDYSLDGISIKINYTHEKGYFIGTNFQTLAKCKTFSESEVIFDVLTMINIENDQVPSMVKLSKYIYRKIKDIPGINHNNIVNQILDKIDIKERILQ